MTVPPEIPEQFRTCPCGAEAASYHASLDEGCWYVCANGHQYGNALAELEVQKP